MVGMKALVILYLIIKGSFGLFAQTEIPLLSLSYDLAASSNYLSENQESIPSLKSTNNLLEIGGSYGGMLNKKNELSSTINYQKIKINATQIKDSLPQNSLTNFYSSPSHSNLVFNLSLKSSLKKAWAWTNAASISLTDDFSGKALKPNLFGGVFSTLEKKKSEKLTFGFGVFVNQLKGDLFFSPLLSLAIKGKKRGLDIFFPERLRLWQKIKSNAYLSLESSFTSYGLIHHPKNSLYGEVRTDISTFDSKLKYNVIFFENLRFEFSIGLPFRSYVISNEMDMKTIYQDEGWFMGIGFSYVIEE